MVVGEHGHIVMRTAHAVAVVVVRGGRGQLDLQPAQKSDVGIT